MSSIPAKPPHKTLEQRRALHALKFVQQHAREAGWEDTKRLAKQLPVRIMTAGLGHALLFTSNKDGGKIIDTLSDWLKARMVPTDQRTDILDRITNGDASFLRRATDETLALLAWINRFAEAAEGEKSADKQARNEQDQRI